MSAIVAAFKSTRFSRVSGPRKSVPLDPYCPSVVHAKPTVGVLLMKVLYMALSWDPGRARRTWPDGCELPLSHQHVFV